ncbi:MAG: hypothetical protein ACKVOW_17375, partial [Chitinophagaceae bacterium]
MKNTNQTILVALVFLGLMACNRSNNSNQFRALLESLENSNQLIMATNQAVYDQLQQKLKDPRTKLKAAIWQPKSEQVKKISADLIEYISKLKNELKKEAVIVKDSGNVVY